MKLLSVLYLTPELFRDYHFRLLGGEPLHIDGLSLNWFLEPFCSYVHGIEAGTSTVYCALCETRLRHMTGIGCVVGLFDPAVLDRGQETLWGALCERCHDENPETAQARLLKRLSDHTGGGGVFNLPGHPTLN
jgi:hypothetical protein